MHSKPVAPIPAKVKRGLYFAAWSAVMVATLLNKPKEALYAPAFPIGFLAALPMDKAIMATWFGGPVVAFGGWMVYVGVTTVMNRAKRPSIFFIVYVLFCILLALNLTGCRKMIDAAAGIQ